MNVHYKDYLIEPLETSPSRWRAHGVFLGRRRRSERERNNRRRRDAMNRKSDVRIWAFWGGVLGVLTAWGHLQPWIGDGIRINLIELITQAGGFALIAAILAYIRNRIWSR